jgi:hypothetical protein
MKTPPLFCKLHNFSNMQDKEKEAQDEQDELWQRAATLILGSSLGVFACADIFTIKRKFGPNSEKAEPPKDNPDLQTS